MMENIIQVFRMTEINAKTRASIIIKLGRAINDQMGMNITEPIVYELVKLLDEQNDILSDEHYVKMWSR